MRLWHWKLIPVLPRQQLLGQWRECCLIAKNIAEKGTPNHILVNPIMDYPESMFNSYTDLIYKEMLARGYSADWHNFHKYRPNNIPLDCSIEKHFLFPGWHTDTYLKQCIFNLQEKYDRGGITDEEWELIRRNNVWILES